MGDLKEIIGIIVGRARALEYFFFAAEVCFDHLRIHAKLLFQNGTTFKRI